MPAFLASFFFSGGGRGAGGWARTSASTAGFREAVHSASMRLMISQLRGSSLAKAATGHFSRASGMTVWLVKARAARVMSHARPQARPSPSTSRRISSDTAQVGWVSFIWKMAKDGRASQSPAAPAGVALNRPSTSCRAADTKKYCCFRRSSLPSSVASLGYRTAVISAADRADATASTKRPSLKAARSSSVAGRASHRRRLPTVGVAAPGMGTSYAWAVTTSAGCQAPVAGSMAP